MKDTPTNGTKRVTTRRRAPTSPLAVAQQALGMVTWIWDARRDRVKWFGDIGCLLGLAPGGFSGGFADYLVHVHPEERERARRTYVDCLKGRSPTYRAEERVVWPDGSVRWLETYGNALYDTNGRTIEMSGVVRDCTDRKRSEERFQRSEGMLAAVFHQIATPILISRRRDGVIVEANRAWERVSGFGRTQVIGRSGIATGHWTDPEARARIVREVGAHGRVEDELVRFMRPDGVERQVLVSCVAFDLEGEPHLLWSSSDVTESRRSAARALQLDSKYAAVFATTPDAVAIARQRDSVHLEVNAAWERLTGYPKERAIGRSALELGMWRDRAERAGAIERLDADGTVINYPTRFVRADGGTIDVLLSGAKLAIDDQPCVVWSWSDVTEQRRAQAQAQQSLQRFTALFDTNPGGIMVARARDRTIVEINDVALRLLGASREEAIGASVHDFVRAADQKSLDDRRDRILAGERTNKFAVAFTRRDGSTFESELSTGLIEIDGEPHLLTTVNDVTERRARERALAESEERFAKAFDSSQEAIGISRLSDSRMVAANRRMEQLWGAPAAEMIGKTTLELSIWTEVPDSRARILETLRTQGSIRDLEVGIRTRSGEVRTCNYSADVIEIAGEPYAIDFLRDITDQRAAERARVEAEAEVKALTASLEQRVQERTAALEAANRELESFSYSVSHDLRAPLRAITGFSAILRDDYGASIPSEALPLLQRIEHNAMRMGELIDDLLELSRAGRVVLERHSIDMSSIVQSVLGEQQAGPGVCIEIGDLPPANGDATLLKQVWQNLIGNALKFSARTTAPHVEIGATSTGDGVEYYVRDNGAGFDMRYAGKLFGLFQRMHSPTEYEGTGVGLAIVQRIVHRHGGKVSAEAELGHGATFRFTLPAG